MFVYQSTLFLNPPSLYLIYFITYSILFLSTQHQINFYLFFIVNLLPNNIKNTIGNSNLKSPITKSKPIFQCRFFLSIFSNTLIFIQKIEGLRKSILTNLSNKMNYEITLLYLFYSIWSILLIIKEKSSFKCNRLKTHPLWHLCVPIILLLLPLINLHIHLIILLTIVTILT